MQGEGDRGVMPPHFLNFVFKASGVISKYTFYYDKSTEIEINIGRRQKQVIDVYVHLLKAPSLNRSPRIRLLERFYSVDLFSASYGIYKNLVFKP